ncbi:MAG: S8 family serine peptidase, partial [Planctomycetota bacterium]|nr:S8 family serine peptidase [Planctomycetota bacterium]
MKRRKPSRGHRNPISNVRRSHFGEALEARVLLAVDGLSPAVRAAFERASDLDNQFTRGQLRDAKQWVVLMSDGSNGESLADALATTTHEFTPTNLINNAYIVDTLTIVPAKSSPGTGGLPIPPQPEEVIAKLKSIGNIEYFYPLASQQIGKFFVPEDDLFQDQWHLQNNGQTGGSPGSDINVTDVWDTYTGTGVIIGIVDDGLEIAHPDLEDRIEDGLSLDLTGVPLDPADEDPTPEADGDGHGTAVAGVAAASQGNLIGGVGAAFGASLAGIRIPFDNRLTDAVVSAALTRLPNRIDIYNNSWGEVLNGRLSRSVDPLTLAALEGTAGRNGLGSIFVFAAGNDRQQNSDVNYSVLTNSRHSIAVGAINDDGIQTSYSRPGASLFIATYSGDGALGITTTDLVGERGYNTSAEEAEGDYTDTFGGTSSAAPLLSGGIALVLQANPGLSRRDVQHILAKSAVKTDDFDEDWVTNGAGLHVNHKYGFGSFDAQAATTLAQSWTNVAAEKSINIKSAAGLNIAIPDNNTRGITSSILVDSGIVDGQFVNRDMSVEWVEVIPKIDHAIRGDLELVLRSPSGTESVLARQRGKNDAGGYSNWVFTTNRNWGETSLGEWTLTARDLASGAAGTLTSWEMNIYGTEVPQVPIVGGGTVTGFKWNDANANGVRESGEEALQNWRIFVDLNNDGHLTPGEPSAATDGTGNYSLTAPAGTHAVREQQKADWEQTFPVNNGPHTISVFAGATIPNINFGNRIRLGQITGVKWNDTDADGFHDRKEIGVAGITVYMDLNRNGQLDSNEPNRVTDTSGRFAFKDLSAGSYQIREVPVPGVPQTFPVFGIHNITLEQGETVNIEFGNAFAAESAYGTTWVDSNGDGLVGLTEGRLPGLIVYVDQNNDGRIGYGEPSALTDASGNYRFAGLAVGNPSIRVVVPPGLDQTTPRNNGGYLTSVREGSAAVNLRFGFTVQSDFGDAPAPYPTLLSENGPVHPIETGFFLGANVDAETDGTPSANADGDDATTTDDENGVQFATPLIAGQTARIDVTASKQGYLQGWIDFNGDGDWLDAGERILTDQLIPGGVTRLVVNVPSNSTNGRSVARFRFAHESGLSFAGPARSGEVEDYIVTIQNTAVPVTPAEANDDLLSVLSNSVNTIVNVLANDALGGVGLTIDAIGTPSRGGVATLSADARRINYTPAAGFAGIETFNYVVRNANGQTDSAIVTVTVREVPPVLDAVNDTFTVNQNTVNSLLSVLANDSLGGGGRVISAVGPTNRGGTAVIAAGAQGLLYTPATGFVGSETFTYTIRDTNGTTDTASVTVTVRAVILANAGDDALAVQQNSTNNTLDVLANDSSDSALVISSVSATNNGGTVTIAANGKSLIYTPANNFLGSETFTYTIRDLEGDTDQATVTVSVLQPATITANADTFNVTSNTTNHILNPIANDVLTGIGSISISAIGTTSNGGSVAIVSNATRLQYSPAASFVGTETFTYTITNGSGLTSTALVSVVVAATQVKTVSFRLETTTNAGIPITSITVGSTFQLRGYVRDLRTAPEGVFAAFLDVAYDTQLVNATGTINHGTQYTTGTAGSLATDGVIDEVGGINKDGTGNGNEFLLFVTNFTADAAGSLRFTPDMADSRPVHDVLLFGTSTRVPIEQIDFRDTSIEIVSMTNLANTLDVNGDNYISAIDALLVINELNKRGARSIAGPMSFDTRPLGLVDVNQDGYVSAIDALLIINHLNRVSAAAAAA